MYTLITYLILNIFKKKIIIKININPLFNELSSPYFIYIKRRFTEFLIKTIEV